MGNGIRECGTRNREMHAEGVGGLRVSTLGRVFLNRICPGGAPGTPFERSELEAYPISKESTLAPIQGARV